MRSICQQDRHELTGSLLNKYGTTKTSANQQGKAATVIQVSMAEYHGIYAGRFEWERITVSFFVFAPALDQATVQQHCLVSDPKNMAGTRYFTRCSKKLDFHKRSLANPVSN
jgi:hypothetical protein